MQGQGILDLHVWKDGFVVEGVVLGVIFPRVWVAVDLCSRGSAQVIYLTGVSY